MKKTAMLYSKHRKKCLFYAKSLVGLTPGLTKCHASRPEDVQGGPELRRIIDDFDQKRKISTNVVHLNI
jgi:hypothetical protein